MNKAQAYLAMLEGHKIRHEYYGKEEFAYIKDGSIWTEEGCNHGGYHDEFWSIYQKWLTGWSIVE